jgi:TatD DNase family protein
MITDTHCHLDFPEYRDDLDQVLTQATEAGVHRIIIPGVDLDSAAGIVPIITKYPQVYCALGVHPQHVDDLPGDWLDMLKEQVAAAQAVKKLVAIGEIGLDYFREPDKGQRELQREVFVQQLELAQELDLPVILHSRACFDDLYAVIKESGYGLRCVVHCFTGSTEEAQQWLQLGCNMSFTGILTYKRSDELRETMCSLPATSIWFETDGPFLAPEGHRGKRAVPEHSLRVLEVAATMRGVTVTELAATVENSVEAFFNFPG